MGHGDDNVDNVNVLAYSLRQNFLGPAKSFWPTGNSKQMLIKWRCDRISSRPLQRKAISSVVGNKKKCVSVERQASVLNCLWPINCDMGQELLTWTVRACQRTHKHWLGA